MYWKRTHSCGVWVSSGVLSYKCSADMAMSSSSFGPVGPLGLPALLVLPDCTDYDLGADKLHLPRDLGDVWRSRKTACPVHPAVCNSFGTRFFQSLKLLKPSKKCLPNSELVTLARTCDSHCPPVQRHDGRFCKSMRSSRISYCRSPHTRLTVRSRHHGAPVSYTHLTLPTTPYV